MNDLISIIVPIYNVEKYLNRCVKSIINQTYKNTEIILVDDGSPDNCPDICDKYANKDKRIKVIHKKNGGLSDARNKGIEKAKGKYIMFVDSDDWLPKNATKSLYKKTSENNLDICVGIFKSVRSENEVIDNNTETKEIIYTPEEALEKLMYMHDFTNSACGKIYKKDLFNNIKYPKGKYYEDLGTTYKLFAISKKIGFIDKIVYYYNCKNEGSIMHKKYTTRRLEGIEFATEELTFIEKKYKKIIPAAIYRLFFECLSVLNDMPYKCKDKNKIIKIVKKYRVSILKDRKLKLKQRLLCASSYLGMIGIKTAFFIKNL